MCKPTSCIQRFASSAVDTAIQADMLVQAAVPMQLRIDDSRPPIHMAAIHKNNARNAACYVREQVYQRTGLKCGMALAQLFEPNVVYPAWFFCSSLPACRQRIVCFSRQSGYFLDIFQKHTCSAGEESFMDVLLHLLIWSTLAFPCVCGLEEPLKDQWASMLWQIPASAIRPPSSPPLSFFGGAVDVIKLSESTRTVWVLETPSWR